jgi:site-specific recombinase XerC
VVKELESWKRYLNAAEDDFVFRKLSRKGEITNREVTIREMIRVVKEGVTSLGVGRLEADDVACHSLRSGFACSAADRNVPINAIRERTRHRNLASLQPYLKDSQIVNHGI